MTGFGGGRRRTSLFFQLERMSSSSSMDSWDPAVGHVEQGTGVTRSCPGSGSAGRVADGGGGGATEALLAWWRGHLLPGTRRLQELGGEVSWEGVGVDGLEVTRIGLTTGKWWLPSQATGATCKTRPPKGVSSLFRLRGSRHPDLLTSSSRCPVFCCYERREGRKRK